MEKLHLRSDGYSETPSGLFATVMTRYTGVTPDGKSYHFTVRLCPTCDGTRLEWPVNTSIMLLSQDLVSFLEGKRYARGLVAEEITAYNEAVDAYLQASGEQGVPGASPVAIEGENAPSDGAPGEGDGSENEPPAPPEEEPAPGEAEPPVATDGEAGSTPPAEPEEQPASTEKKAKKG